MDAFVLQAIARELDEALRGARLEKAGQVDPFTFVLTFSDKDRRPRRLLLSGSLSRPRLHLTADNPPGPPQPGDFLMSLRKHLAGSRLTRAAAGEWERVAQLTFERPGGEAFALLAEVMGRWSNLLLLEGKTGVILDALRLSGDEANPTRPIERGGVYRLPPAQKKRAPGSVEEGEFLRLLAGAKLAEGDEEARACWLVRAFAGLSPAMAAEVAGRAGDDGRSFWQAFAWAAGCYREGRFRPTLLLDARGNPAGLSALEVRTLPPERVRSWPSMNEAADVFYREAAGGASLEAGRAAAAGEVRGHLRRAERNLAAVERDLRQAEAAEDCRLRGELLLRNLGAVEEKAASLRLEHEGAPLEIALDPRFSPSENAQRYFRRYKKLKRLLGAGGRRRRELEAERTFLEGLLYDAEEAEGPEALAGVRQALGEGGFGKKEALPAKKKKGRAAAPPSRPYLRLLAPGGWEIFVGKNALGNEALLRRVGRAGDTWLHAQGLPGSHVLLRAAGEPGEEALLQAAALAAYHSRGRRDSRVRVDYLPVERLRRPRGGRPGQVIFTGQRTLLASPTEGERLLKELREPEG